MKLKDIRDKAQGLGVKSEGLKKADLIRAIQKAEGYNQCYGTFGDGCVHVDCCFRSDCRKEKAM